MINPSNKFEMQVYLIEYGNLEVKNLSEYSAFDPRHRMMSNLLDTIAESARDDFPQGQTSIVTKEYGGRCYQLTVIRSIKSRAHPLSVAGSRGLAAESGTLPAKEYLAHDIIIISSPLTHIDMCRLVSKILRCQSVVKLQEVVDGKSKDVLEQVQAQVDELREDMLVVLDKALARGESIEDLKGKAEELNVCAVAMERKAKRLNRCC
jgi:hypothetical protein